MLEHRMAGKAELAGDAHAFIAGDDRSKSDAGVHDVPFDAVEPPEEVEMPPRAAEFAVADRLQAERFLLGNDALDLPVFNIAERGRGDLALGETLARRFQGSGAKQAADMIGAKRRFSLFHHHWSPWRQLRAHLCGITGSRRLGAGPVMTSPTLPTPRPPVRHWRAVWPIARPRTGRCLPRSKQSRIAARGTADRERRIWSPRRCGA